MLRGWLLVCSITSISPVAGQTPVPTNQKAGHVPHLNFNQHSSPKGHTPLHSHISRQMLHIKNKKPMRIRLRALQPNRLPSKIRTRIKNSNGIDAPTSNASVADFGQIDQSVLLSCSEVHVVDVAESRIEAFVEGEAAVEEVEALVGLDEVESLAVNEAGEGEDDPWRCHCCRWVEEESDDLAGGDFEEALGRGLVALAIFPETGLMRKA
jgi:hypothetical protein